jgi:hypothetical protein
MSSLKDRARHSLQAAGLDQFKLLATSSVESEVVFVDNGVALRFVSDRGEDFIDIAPSVSLPRFFMMDDLDIAMGWRSVGEVVMKRKPEPLNLVLARIAVNWRVIRDKFAPPDLDSTLEKLRHAELSRAQAMHDRLK